MAMPYRRDHAIAAAHYGDAMAAPSPESSGVGSRPRHLVLVRTSSQLEAGAGSCSCCDCSADVAERVARFRVQREQHGPSKRALVAVVPSDLARWWSVHDTAIACVVSEQNVKIVRALVAAGQRGDWEGALEKYDPAVELDMRLIPGGDLSFGREAVRSFFTNWFGT
jgi:hypothetical protein